MRLSTLKALSMMARANGAETARNALSRAGAKYGCWRYVLMRAAAERRRCIRTARKRRSARTSAQITTDTSAYRTRLINDRLPSRNRQTAVKKSGACVKVREAVIVRPRHQHHELIMAS